MKHVDQLLQKIGVRAAPPYPVDARRRVIKSEEVRRGGKLEVFDAPEALAINDARMSHLESLGLPLAGKRVLDAGCGVGHLASRLERMGCQVVCVDGRKENIEALRTRYPGLEAHAANVESEPLSRFGRFNVVFSYGLLYHLENPLESLRNLQSVCDDLLLLETIICDHELPLVRAEDESPDFNQALGGLGCRPTPHYVVLALNRVGFPHVYAPVSPPEHRDFQFEWQNNLDAARDGHPLRCVFVASRKELKNRRLVSLLKG